MAAAIGSAALGGAASAAPEPLNASGEKDAEQTLFRALNGPPAENLAKVIDLIGGIETLIGDEDVVLLKPNVQWWNQGAPNLAAVERLVELIMARPGGFRGEVVLAENNHRGAKPWEHAGWRTPFARNADLEGVATYGALCERLQRRYPDRFAVCHWIDVAAGGRRVHGPAEGAGYVWCDGTGGVPLLQLENGAMGDKRRAVIMTYPIFATGSGRMVDFRLGIWERGSYTGRPLKFFNLAALNHHSSYCGATVTLKNYLGVTDLSGGPDPHAGGTLGKDYHNFHSFPFDKWAAGPVAGMLGAEVAEFMHSVRRADLNIVTAEWAGLASRTEPPVARTRAVVAGVDPVALDEHCARTLLHPNSRIRFHNPQDPRGPLHQTLAECARRGGGLFDPRRVAVKSFDLQAGRLQSPEELVVRADRVFGSDVKTLFKYAFYYAGLGG
jgi:hypothetical protein